MGASQTSRRKAFSPRRPIKRAAILRPSAIRHVLRVIDALSRWPARDALVVLISVCAGMRCTEIARVTVADVLHPNGQLRDEITLRSAITKGNHPRIAYFTNTRLRSGLERYLRDRTSKGIGVVSSDDYRGLAPDLPLVFCSRKGPFTLAKKRRTLESGQVEIYEAADGLETQFRRIYARAGVVGGSSHAGRRTYSSRLLERGVASEDISKLLGHQNLSHTTPYLVCTEAMLEEAFKSAI